jgi:hypothetical protein
MWESAGERYKHRWDNIIRDIQGTEWGNMDWTELVWDTDK